MSHCELFELQISILLDGEADIHEQTAVMDHLLGCADCRRFYQEARVFQGTLDALPLAESEAPATKSQRRFLGAMPVWAQAAAVVLLMAVGVTLGLGLRWESQALPEFVMPSTEQPIDLRLASNSGAMSEAEFVNLTLHLLRADSRYQRKMLDILRILDLDDYSRAEGGLDDALDREQAAFSAQSALGTNGQSAAAQTVNARRAIY